MILVVSYPDEEHSIDVINRLKQKGHEVILIDLADFPLKNDITLLWENNKKPKYLVHDESFIDKKYDIRNAKVGWWRRVRAFSIDSKIANNSMRAFAESETSQAIGGMLDSLQCTWVNDRRADDAAHHKPFQWEIAQDVGLLLPKTLVTTCPDEARKFIKKQGSDKTIYKAFLASTEDWRETRVVEKQDIDNLELVKYAPVIFQEYIKGVDLRITVVGNKIFAAEIDVRQSSYPFDMRMMIGETIIKPIILPEKLCKTILSLQKRLGLEYGAIDMRRTDNGEYVFFEVNPAGQWLFVEQRTGLQISQAICDMLSDLDDK